LVLKTSHTINCRKFHSEGLTEILARIRNIDALVWIFFFYAFAKVTFFLYLASINRIIVPDEGTYARTVCYFNQGLPTLAEFGTYTTWGPLFLLPAQFFNFLGVNCLTSTRLNNLFFSLASGLIFLMLIFKFKRTSFAINRRFIEISIYSLFLFLPSKFLWSSIGIREAVIEFLLITSVFLLYTGLESKRIQSQFAIYLILLVTLTFLSMSRWMLYLCLLITILSFLIFLHRKTNAKKLILISVISLIMSFFLPSILAKNYAGYLESSKKKEIFSIEKKSRELLSKNSKNPENEKLMEEIARLNQEISRLKETAANIPMRAYTIPDPDNSRTVRTQDARSKIESKTCNLNTVTFTSIFLCNLKHLPIGLYSVLMRPNPIHDWYSPTTKLASVENLIYLGFLSYLFFVMYSRTTSREAIQKVLLPMIFLGFSIIGLALYEGNIGTAFRHKSITVWAICLSLHAYTFFYGAHYCKEKN